MVVTSLKPRSEIYSRTPDLWPSDPQWDQYANVLDEGHVARALANSLIVSTSAMVIGVVIASLAAYALARFAIPLKRLLLMTVLATQMFPLVVLVIPLFVLMRQANLLGTYWGLVASYLAFTVPLAIWIMRSFILTIPEELEHAAMIDGTTRVGAMVRVVLPLAAPGLMTTAMLSFIAAWHEFMLALTFLTEEERKTLPLILQTFVGRADTDWGASMATSTIYTLPVMILFLILRGRLMKGTTVGALKG
jgi:ABC-type glycerol-3-phosphate transport system permease component